MPLPVLVIEYKAYIGNLNLLMYMKPLFTLIIALFATQAIYAQKLVQEGTVVTVKLLETLSSATCKQGEIVNMEVSEDVMVDGVAVIKKGAKVTGSVVECVPKQSMGRKGKLDFSIDFVVAADGQNIRVRSTVGSQGKDRTGGVVAAAVIVSPFLLFVKGKDTVIEKGTSFSVYVDKEYTVKAK